MTTKSLMSPFSIHAGCFLSWIGLIWRAFEILLCDFTCAISACLHGPLGLGLGKLDSQRTIRKTPWSRSHSWLPWLIDFLPSHLFPASSHSEQSGVASWWSNRNPILTDSEARSQERFKPVKMSTWLKAQLERFAAARHEPTSLQILPKDITQSS